MDGVSHRLDRLGPRCHRLRPVRHRPAPCADRSARRTADGRPTWRGRRLSQHGRAAGLGIRRLPVRHYRRLYRPGAGAEIVVGIPLVAEAFAASHRAKVLGVMMTGGAFGSIISGQIFNLVGPFGWRYVFFVGIAPALLLLFIRRSLAEPAHFHAVRERRATVMSKDRAATE